MCVKHCAMKTTADWRRSFCIFNFGTQGVGKYEVRKLSVLLTAKKI